MSNEQREALDAALRSIPLDLSQSVADHREGFLEFAVQPLPNDVVVTDVSIGGVRALELAITNRTNAGTLLYLHGGGYVVGSARTGARLAVELARRSGTRALSVDYRLAPEHAFPAAVDDGLAAYRGLLDSGVQPAELVLAGDSAGGGLAVATLLAARNEGLAQPAAVAVFSPWVDLTLTGASLHTKAAVDPLFTYDAVRWYADQYVPIGDRSAATASPVFADLRGLPPLLIQGGSHEVLLDDALRLAARAASDDVEVTLQVTPNVPHVFQNSFEALEEADRALDSAGQFLAGYLSRVGA